MLNVNIVRAIPTPVRLFSPVPLQPAQQLALDEEQTRYLRLALRLRVGDKVVLFDGSGGEYIATIAHIGKGGVDVDTGFTLPRNPERSFPPSPGDSAPADIR